MPGEDIYNNEFEVGSFDEAVQGVGDMASGYKKTMLTSYKAAHRNVCVVVRKGHVGTWPEWRRAGLVSIMAAGLPEPARILEGTKA